MAIQARWFGGEYGRRFTGVDGEAIEIVQFGHWNRGAGPDFTEAAVRIDGELRTGAIEVDPDARDWEGHGHGVNPDFDQTVLHVFADGPALHRFFTRTSRHRRVIQLQLPQHAWAQGPPDFLPEAMPGRCVAPLAEMDDEEVASLLFAAAEHRFRRKSRRLRVMMDATSVDQAMFQAVAEALGFHRNRVPMAILSQRCPLRRVRRLDARDREALLFGSAGFLGRRAFDEPPEADAQSYLRDLGERWRGIRETVRPSPRRAIPWRLAGARPANHPHRRLGALAVLAGRWQQLAEIWQRPVNNVEQFVNDSLKNLEHPFWSRRYTLGSTPSDSRVRLLGKDRRRDLLGNVIFPAMAGVWPDSPSRWWDPFLALRGVDSNRSLRRAALRLFGPDPERRKLFTSYYHQQQGLLQIYRDFCLEDHSECRDCPFPEQLTQWRREADSSQF